MIKFFRKIRQKLLSDLPAGEAGNKFSKYMLYAIGEIVLVVIGILIALQINNWNENRINRQKEAIYLTELKKALEGDLRGEFVPADMRYASILKGAEKTMNLIENEVPVPSDSSAIYFWEFAKPEWDFVFNMGAFENLKSIGMDIVSNDSIRSRISALYSYSYPNIREVNQNYIRYFDVQVSPLLYSNFKLSRNQNFTKSELEILKSNIQIFNTLKLLRVRRIFLHKMLIIPVRKEVEALIDAIEIELDKLEYII